MSLNAFSSPLAGSIRRMGMQIKDHESAQRRENEAWMAAQRQAVSPDTRPIRNKQPKPSVINRLIQYIREM